MVALTSGIIDDGVGVGCIVVVLSGGVVGGSVVVILTFGLRNLHMFL